MYVGGYHICISEDTTGNWKRSPENPAILNERTTERAAVNK